jgi:hypothetical protein
VLLVALILTTEGEARSTNFTNCGSWPLALMALKERQTAATNQLDLLISSYLKQLQSIGDKADTTGSFISMKTVRAFGCMTLSMFVITN